MILDGQLSSSITAAAQALQRGELLGLPTETVYGLAADAGNDQAVAKIFEAKGRPANHPLIVHVASAQEVTRFVSTVPDFAQRLMDAFWPGPLTLILPRRPEVAASAAGGQNSVGVRCPSHTTALAVLQAAQALGVYGVAAPSANLFGRVSPTTAAHVAGEFGDDLLIVDGGACEVGIESTIVDCTRGAPVLLRPGVLTPEQLSQVCGVTVAMPAKPQSDAPRASGTLDSHYAPRATVRLMTIEQMHDAFKQAPSTNERVAVWSRSLVQTPAAWALHVHSQPMPVDARQCAHDLFAQLRNFDAQGMTQIWVEIPPATSAWDGVRDRLTRAATPVTKLHV
jgi:L-threonylcarbamoyladenylate synthase